MFLSGVMKMFQLQSKVSKSLLSVAAIAGLALVGAGAANAGTVTQSFSYGGQYPTTSPESVLQFDSSLGTLTSVDLSIADTSNETATITNTSTTASNFNVQLGSLINVTDPSHVQLLSANSSSNGTTYSISNLAPNASATVPSSGSAATTLSASNTLTSGLSEFIGNGLLTLDVANSGSSAVTGSNNYGINITGGSSGTFNVVYNYSTASTPIPATGLLSLVGGLVMVGGVAIHRRMKA